ncbi:MAG: hypothetical protein ACFFG0_11200 [Candidatus Thorarchaeota archaeon]
MSIWKVKEGKLEETLTVLGKFYYEFINLEGCEYIIKIWHTFQEALAAVGMKLP